MSLLTGSDIGKSYAHRYVFSGFSFAIEHGDRIGLVGINGGGKTTLLRIIAGLESSEPPGQIHHKRGLQVGYLAQDAGGPIPDGTVWETMLEGVTDLRRLEAELQSVAAELTGADDDPLLARYSSMQADFERRDGYLYETRIHTVLAGLGFHENDCGKALSELSGGQRTRVQLARLLVEGSDLLLLDEPTNYLDLRAVEWLEGWLRDRDGGYLVVSHDRWFLDRVTERTWEISFGRLEAYRGGYSAYVRQRQERYERHLKEWEAQQAYVEKTEEFVRRFLAGQRTKEAQGRRKRLQRFLRHEAIERPQQHRRMHLRMESSGRTGDIVLRLTDLALGYGQDEPVVRTAGEVEALCGQRVAVIGPNGAGKTTLVRAILGQLAPQAGQVHLGAKVEIGYLPQTQEYLDPSLTLVESLREVASEETKTGELRDLLGSFLFSGDDVDKRVEQISGGERSRVALARLVLQGANFLILDEPTNHLDINSQEVLEGVLADFTGTVLLVSHDRYLIQSLATQIWVVEAGGLTPFDGNWSQYCEWRERRAATEVVQGVAAPVVDDREARRVARRQRKAHEELQEGHVRLEARIASLEEKKTGLGEQIGRASEARDMDLLAELTAALQQVETDLEQDMAQWEDVGRQLEEYAGTAAAS